MMTSSTLPAPAAPAIDDVDGWASWLDARRHEVRRIVGYALRDVAATDDLVQEVLIAAWSERAQLEPGRDPGPWLRTVARNAVRKELRRQLREERRLAIYGERLLARLADGHAFDARDAELRAGLARCREQLADHARQALAWRYEDGLDFAAIAARAGRTLAAARQLLTRTRAQLRDCIEGRQRHDDRSTER